jgi:hypothetical protein
MAKLQTHFFKALKTSDTCKIQRGDDQPRDHLHEVAVASGEHAEVPLCPQQLKRVVRHQLEPAPPSAVGHPNARDLLLWPSLSLLFSFKT